MVFFGPKIQITFHKLNVPDVFDKNYICPLMKLQYFSIMTSSWGNMNFGVYILYICIAGSLYKWRATDIDERRVMGIANSPVISFHKK